MSTSNLKALTLDQVYTITRKALPDANNIEVLNFRSEPFSKKTLGFLGFHELLTVELRDSKQDSVKCITFFVKHALKLQKNSFFNEEKKFYVDLVPQLLEFKVSAEPWLPNCYLATDDFLVLENLQVQMFKSPENLLNPEKLRCVMIRLAHLHASSMLLEKKLKTSLNKIYSEFFKDSKFFSIPDLRKASHEVTVAVAHSLNLKSDGLFEALKLADEKSKFDETQTNVLCMIDTWYNNFMFRDGDDSNCRLVDFQTITYTSYAVDLARFLYLNLDKDMINKMYENLIELYHSTLTSTLKAHDFDKSKIITLEKVYQDVEDKKICGLGAAAVNWPVTMLNDEWKAEFTKNKAALAQNFFVSRKDIVLKAMETDEIYRVRVEEAVKQLVEFVQKQNDKE